MTTPAGNTPPKEKLTPPLKSLGGPTQLQLKRDLRRLTLLPNEALGNLWQVLGPFLGEQPPKDRLEPIIASFCREHDVAMQDLMPALASCRMLIRGAARECLSPEAFVEDLELLELDVVCARALMAGYGQALALVRSELLMHSLMDHGRVLTRTQWRIDHMDSSDRGKGLAAPVATLTFHYQDGDGARRFSLQALPPVLRQLRDVIDTLLEDGRDDKMNGRGKNGAGLSKPSAGPTGGGETKA